MSAPSAGCPRGLHPIRSLEGKLCKSVLRFLLFGSLLAVAACDDATPPTANLEVPAPPRFSYSGEAYPLHAYYDESDHWAYMSPENPVYTELWALDQTPDPLDGYDKRRVCPNEEVQKFNAHLRMTYNREEIDLDFRGPFTFLRHVSTTSPYPTALYRFNRNAYTRDNKYYAPAGGNVLLACDGNYIVDNRVLGRVWYGYLYGKLYNGPIVRNPDYDEDCGNNSVGPNGELLPYADAEYDPYNPDTSWGAGDCVEGGTDGGSGGGDESTGTGVYYGPGAHTGGGTVDWRTGEGTGGTSVCGARRVCRRRC